MTQSPPEEFEFLGLKAIIASPRMRQALEWACRVARTPATVLIQGESGSGKEIIARAIHQQSLRCHRPWVDISCAALPEHLMESELFGYERGAFSGADSTKPGLFELASGGTLFLDEVGELEPKMQVKLLRVLDGAPYYRLGGTRKISVDVRVIAATNQDLEISVQQGRFRGDLYHRLSQVRVHVPPLRERVEDILPLARYFLEKNSANCEISEGALRALEFHAWPGNVRELRNLMTRAAILAEGGLLCAGDLGLPHPAPAPGPLLVPPASPAPAANLDGLERQTILKVLNQTGGHRQRAADILGISRRTLTRKLKQYRLDGFAEIGGLQVSGTYH